MANITVPAAETITTTSPINDLVHGILSYNSNIMLAAIISLLLVILFVLLLHVYAKWFLVQARQRSRRSVTVPQVLGSRFHHFHAFTLEATFATSSSSPTKGLDSSLISAIPLFVYRATAPPADHHDKQKHGVELECVICLSLFENEDVGRRLPKCSHAFHVECIDMWLHSHSNCPICRAPVVSDSSTANTTVDSISSPNVEHVVHSDQESPPPERTLGDHQGFTALEIIVEEEVSENDNISSETLINDSSSVTLSSTNLSQGSSSLGASVKRMLTTSTKNRSERKIHPSLAVNESEV